MALTIDHIVPVGAGGGDDEANLWPAHRICNEEKGDDLGWDDPTWVRLRGGIVLERISA